MTTRILLATVAVLVGIVVGLVSGFLVWVNGSNVLAGIFNGVAGFAAAVLLVLALLTFIAGGRGSDA